MASEKHNTNSVAASIAAPRMRSNREDGNEGSSRSGSGSVNIRYSTQKHFHMSIPPCLALAAIYPNQGAVVSPRIYRTCEHVTDTVG